MASAGRILIMPKGNWNAETTYENLDLVFHEGTSWVAKKVGTGIEPSEEHSEHWFKMCETTDLTEIYNRIVSAENRITELEIAGIEVDLTPYATAENLTALDTRVGTAETKIASFEETLNGIPSAFPQAEIVTRKGTGASTENYPASVEFSFAPDVVIILGGISSITNVWRSAQGDSTIVCNLLTTEFQNSLGFYNGGNTETTNYSFAKKSEDGKTIYWYQTQNTQNANCHFNAADTTYTLLAIKLK